MKRFSYYFALSIILLALVLPVSVIAQDEKPQSMVLVVTTVHWNFDYEDGSPADWLAIEKEYFDKVTMKNEHIVASNFLYHFFTADNREAIAVSLYKDLGSIEAAGKRSSELEEEAWPDEDEREAFFKKRNAYYSTFHSDEIFRTGSTGKSLESVPEEGLVYYLQVNQNAFVEDGSMEDYNALAGKYAEEVTFKNEYVLASYPSFHYWGSDARDVNDVTVFKSLADLEASFDRTEELIEAAWPDEEERKDFFKKLNRYTTGVHADYIYTNEPALMKLAVQEE